MLKKIKTASANKKKAQALKKPTAKATVVKGNKTIKSKKASTLVNKRQAAKQTKSISLKKETSSLKATKISKIESAKANSVASRKSLGASGLVKQWAQAKKAWIQAIQREIQQTSLSLKQDGKALIALQSEAKSKASNDKRKTTNQTLAKAKKLAKADKLQKAAVIALQKKIQKTQKQHAQLTALLLKARGMTKLLSQFDKDWKASGNTSVAAPKPSKKSAEKSAKKSGGSRRNKKAADQLNTSLDTAKNKTTENLTVVLEPEAEAA